MNTGLRRHVCTVSEVADQRLYSWIRSQCYECARFEWWKCVYVSNTVFLNINKWYSQLETYTLSVALIYVWQRRKIYHYKYRSEIRRLRKVL